MGQVPNLAPLIIGNGRLAKHLKHYFDLSKKFYIHWNRQENNLDQLKILSNQAAVVYLCISDSQIESFIQSHDFLQKLPIIHFSGSLETDLAFGCHPLMSFSYQLFNLSDYEKIAFVSTHPQFDFSKYFEGLKNPHFQIPVEKKSYYHSLCVIGNNFTNLLFFKFFSEMKNLGISDDVLFHYLQKTTDQFIQDPIRSLTGPLVRKDLSTLQKNKESLRDDEFLEVYQAFENAYAKMSLQQKRTP